MIIVTELGDKTFFIAAVLAMRDDRLMIFGGAIGTNVRGGCVRGFVRSFIPFFLLNLRASLFPPPHLWFN